MKIVLASDHRGYGVVALLHAHLVELGYEATILGSTSEDACDYPDRAWLVADEVESGNAEFGVLVCGSGIGMSIAANKHRGIRAALVQDEAGAVSARAHNHANVICLSADRLEPTELACLVDIFLATEVLPDRHEKRVRKMTVIEEGRDPSLPSG